MRNVVFFLLAACAPVADVNAPANDPSNTPSNTPFEDACAGADDAAIREARIRVENIQIAEGVLAHLRATLVEFSNEAMSPSRRYDLGFMVPTLIETLEVVALEVPEVAPAALGIDTSFDGPDPWTSTPLIGVLNEAVDQVDRLQVDATVAWQDAMAEAPLGCALTASPLTAAPDVDAPAWRAALTNVNNGLGVVDELARATRKVESLLTRMRRAAVESATETTPNRQRERADVVQTRLAGEIDRTAYTTEYQLIFLADGADTTLEVQVGFRDPEEARRTLILGDLTSSTLGIDSADVDLTAQAGAIWALTQIDAALDMVRETAGRAEAYRAALTTDAAHIKVMLGE
jgi:hypothetical protein